MQRQHRSKLPSVIATKRLQPLATSSGMRARNFASRESLASSSPVDTQLSIQTRAIPSYSSGRAGRIDGCIIGKSMREQHAEREQ
jgi:hypothetical protein